MAGTTVYDAIVKFTGDLSGVNQQMAKDIPKAAEQAGTKAGSGFSSKFSGGLKNIGSGLVQGLGLGAGLMAFQAVDTAISKTVSFIGDSVKAAQDAQASEAKLTTSLKDNVKGWDGSTAAIDAAIKSRTALGFTENDQRDTLARLVGVTHDSTKALDLQREAMDLARYKNIDLTTASTLVGKVYGGNTAVLARYGIQLQKGATVTEALGQLQAVVSGQAETFGNTSAGAAEKVSARMEALQETIGNGLLPVVTAIQTFVADDLLPAFQSIVQAVGDWIAANQPLIQGIGSLIGNIVGLLVPAIGTIIGILGQVIDAISPVIAAFVGFVQTIMPPLMTVIGIVAQLAQAWIQFEIAVVKVIVAVVGAIVGFVSSVIGAAGKIIGAIMSIPGAIAGLVGQVAKVAAGVVGAIVGAAADIVKTILGIPGRVVAWIAGLVSGAGKAASGFVSGILGMAASVVSTILGIPARFVSGLINGFGSAAAQAVQAFIDAILGLPGKVAGILGNVVSNIAGAIGNLIPHFAGGTGLAGVLHDTLAVVHKGEIIIPAQESEALRQGRLAVSGGGTTGTVAPAGAATGGSSRTWAPQITVINPTPEPASTSVKRQLQLIGAFGAGAPAA